MSIVRFLQVLLVDVNSGELVAKFEYVWTFDANLNWPMLKTPLKNCS